MLFLRNAARLACAALLVLVALPAGLVSAAPARAPVTWTVLVGGEAGVEQTANGPIAKWEFMRFYPSTITINEGDSIVWKLNSLEPHTVTFPKSGDKAPDLLVPEGGNSQRMLLNSLAGFVQGGSTFDGTALTGSGQLGGEPQAPKEYTLTFPKTGTYDYICAFHPMMKANVIVQPAGSAYPKTQAQIDAEAKDLLAQDTAAAAKAEPGIQPAADRPGANGSTIHQIKIGYGDGIMAFMRFAPSNLTIRAGDSIEFVQDDVDTPHTVTLVSGGEEPALALAEAQPAGPPKMVLNPQVLAPSGGPVYSGKGYFNSGFIFGTKAPQPGPRSYTLTFDTPGSYEYICVLHDMMGMSGMITVVAQGASLTTNPAPAPAAQAQLPKAGGEPAGQSSLTLLLAGSLLLLGGLVVRRSARQER